MPVPTHHASDSSSDPQLAALATVPAALLRDALGPIAMRARLQAMAAAAAGSGTDATVRLTYTPDAGITIENSDGVLRTRVAGAMVNAQAAVSVDTDVKELQRAVAEIAIGLDTVSEPLTMLVGSVVTIVEASRARPLGRTILMEAMATSVVAHDGSLPLLAAFGLRAAGLAEHDRSALVGDEGLNRLTHAIRHALPNREYEVWTAEMPAWVLAAADVLAARNPHEHEALLASASATLLTLGEYARDIPVVERDLCAAMVLLAACHDGRERVPGPVRGAIPYSIALALGKQNDASPLAGLPTPTLTPSETARWLAILSHPGIQGAAPSAAAIATVLGRGNRTDDIALDPETRRNMAAVARGEVREVDASFALRLTAVPIHVLRGALRAHGRLDDDAMRELPVDDRVRAETVADAWPTATLSTDVLDHIDSAAGRTSARLESAAQQNVRQKRQDAQRSGRRLTIMHLVPSEMAAGSVRRIRVPSRVVSRAALTERVADVESVHAGEPTCTALVLPPAALALAALDAGAPILCNMAHRSAAAVVPGPPGTQTGQRFALVGTWSADVSTAAPAGVLRAALTASPRDVIVLWGDEVLAARAAAADADQTTVGNPGDGIEVSLRRTADGMVIEAGAATLTVGAERAGLLVSVRERVAGSAGLAETALTSEARRIPLAEDAVGAIASALSAAAALQGVGRPADGDGGSGTHPADARIALIASIGSGYVGMHDGAREHVITPAIATTRGTPSRATIAPGALADAMDIARASADAQEARRVETGAAKLTGSARLRFLAGGDTVRVERGRTTVTAIPRVTETPGLEAGDDDYDVSASIAAVAARTGL